MHEIAPGLLWIGHGMDARNPQLLFDAQIKAVVDVAYEQPPAQLPRSLAYIRIPLIDGAGNNPNFMRLAIETVVRLLVAGVPTLIACGAGMSRSPAIAAAALALHQNQPPDGVLREIIAGKPHDISPSIWQEIRAAIGAIEP